MKTIIERSVESKHLSWTFQLHANAQLLSVVQHHEFPDRIAFYWLVDTDLPTIEQEFFVAFDGREVPDWVIDAMFVESIVVRPSGVYARVHVFQRMLGYDD